MTNLAKTSPFLLLAFPQFAPRRPKSFFFFFPPGAGVGGGGGSVFPFICKIIIVY